MPICEYANIEYSTNLTDVLRIRAATFDYFNRLIDANNRL